jgi:hypothetical protein
MVHVPHYKTKSSVLLERKVCMSFKSAVTIEVTRGENKYLFLASAGVSLQECYEVSIDIANKIVDFAKEAEKRQAELNAEQPQADPSVIEEKEENVCDECTQKQN